jgi:hypothetical protein
MAATAWTVKHNPLWTGARPDQNGSVARQTLWHFVSGLDHGNYSPAVYRYPLPPRYFRYVGHVCSKNGSVIPAPSLQLEAWQ